MARSRLDRLIAKCGQVDESSDLAQLARAKLIKFVLNPPRRNASAHLRAIELLLDRVEGRPTTTVRIQDERVPGTVYINSSGEDREPVPVPGETTH
jgi:hypothetical protein